MVDIDLDSEHRGETSEHGNLSSTDSMNGQIVLNAVSVSLSVYEIYLRTDTDTRNKIKENKLQLGNK